MYVCMKMETNLMVCIYEKQDIQIISLFILEFFCQC